MASKIYNYKDSKKRMDIIEAKHLEMFKTMRHI